MIIWGPKLLVETSNLIFILSEGLKKRRHYCGSLRGIYKNIE